jgi:hypothetical protein
VTPEVSIHFEPKLVDAAVASHPKMRELQEKLTKKYGETPDGARAKATELLTRVTKKFGTKYVDAMVERINSLFRQRDAASTVIEDVIGSAQLTPDQAGGRLSGLYKGMKEDMEAITDPGKFAKKSNLKADLDISEDVDQAFAKYEPKPERKITKSRTKARPQAERLGALRDSFNSLKTGKKAVRKAAKLAPKELWRAVASETEVGQQKLISALKAKIGPRMSDAELENLAKAVSDMSLARARAQREAGTLEASLRAKGVAGLRSDVRAIVEGNRTLELLAAENPDELHGLYDRWRASDSPQTRSGFQGYVRREMVSFYSGMHGEFTAAFTLGKFHKGDIVFLKIPDLEPRVPGTDLVAVYKGDRVWMIDNKAFSQSLVDKVSSLTGSFPKNISDDAADFARNPKLGRRGDPVIGDAVARLQKASKEINRLTKGMDNNEIATPTVQKRINKICRDSRIERVVTNAGGEVTDISDALDKAGVVLKDLGITQKPEKP